MQTMFEFKFIEVNPIQSLFFHCHEFDALIDILIKKGADSPTPIIHGIYFCFSCKLQDNISFTSYPGRPLPAQLIEAH